MRGPGRAPASGSRCSRVLGLAAVLCLWNLTISGYSNEYYAAAARAGSESWTAWFFGSLDPGSFITVDKPPLSLWLMGLSARVLGFSLVQHPAAAGAVHDRRGRRCCTRPSGARSGRWPGIAAATALALTPVTVAIARVNNPDALLVLLMVGAAYLLVRALESGRTKHLAWCGALVGLAFMTKMLQGWMIVPALARGVPARRPAGARHADPPARASPASRWSPSSAAWPVAVSLWPAGSQPYIGGSTDGSVWDLILGYNGFGRLTGGEGGGGRAAQLRRRGRPVADVQRAGRRPDRLAAAARRRRACSPACG